MVRLTTLLFLLCVLYLTVNANTKSEEVPNILEPSIITVEELPPLQ